LTELEKISGIKRTTLNFRLKKGWGIKRAMTEEVIMGKNQYG